MNLLRLKYALEVAKAGSLNKASQTLLIAVPNISRSIKELESDLGITIFNRTPKGMELTPEGDELMVYAESILTQLDQLEDFYKKGYPKKQKFSVSVPRASYIAEAFVEFSKKISAEPCEIFYKETNSLETIKNILEQNYDLGIIRYAENYDRYFKSMLEEKNLDYEFITEFIYHVVMSKEHPLAGKNDVTYEDLKDFTEIAHADPYVPAIAPATVFKEELSENVDRRIFVFERGSQFDLLSQNTETYMWVSPIPASLLERYGLVEKVCSDSKKVYKDVLIFKKGRKYTKLDNFFITQLCESKRKYL